MLQKDGSRVEDGLSAGWLKGRRLHSCRRESWEGWQQSGAKWGDLGTAPRQVRGGGRKRTDRGTSLAWDFEDMRGTLQTKRFGSHAQGWEWSCVGVVVAVKPFLSWPPPSDSPSLLCAPHPPPQKLKDEIADVFAQIDCFEIAQER